MSDVQDTWLVCGSDYLHVWITFVYVYKVITLCVGSYYTYRVRGVTLPSLKDSRCVDLLFVIASGRSFPGGGGGGGRWVS